MIRVGDIVEALGLGCLVAAALVAFGVPEALAAGGVSLVYLGQCWGAVRWPATHAPERQPEPSDAATAVRLTTPVTRVNPTIQPEVEEMLARNGARHPDPGTRKAGGRSR